jgi:hypothetical protein
MAFIVALLPKEADRSALGAATADHRTSWARTWREVDLLVKHEPVTAAVVEEDNRSWRSLVHDVIDDRRRAGFAPVARIDRPVENDESVLFRDGGHLWRDVASRLPEERNVGVRNSRVDDVGGVGYLLFDLSLRARGQLVVVCIGVVAQ